MKNDQLIQRKDKVNALYQLLDEYHCVALVGHSGIGKSTFIQLFMNEYQAYYDISIALDSTSEYEMMRAIAQKLGININGISFDKLTENVNEKISSDNLKCMFIFDDLDDISIIKKYFWANDNVLKKNMHILYITKNVKDIEKHVGQFELSAFKHEESKQFLMNQMEINEPVADSLASYLMDYPILLNKGIICIKNNTEPETIIHALHSYQGTDKFIMLLFYLLDKTLSSIELPISPVLNNFFAVISMLKKDYLPIEMLEKIWLECGGTKSEFTLKIKKLENLEILTQNRKIKDKVCYKIHHLVQGYLRQKNWISYRDISLKDVLYNSLYIYYRQPNKNVYIILQIEHMLRENFVAEISISRKITLFHIVSNYYMSIDALTIASQYLSQSEQLLHFLTPDNNPVEYAQFYIMTIGLGIAERNEEMIGQVIPSLEKILTEKKQQLDNDLCDEIKFFIAIAYYETDQTDKSIALLRDYVDRLKIKDLTSTIYENDLLLAHCNLGTNYTEKGEFDLAEKESLQGLEMVLKLSTHSSFRIIGYLCNSLGALYLNTKNPKRDLVKSERYYTQGIAHYEFLPENMRPVRYVGWAYYGLANIYHEKAKESKSLELFQKACFFRDQYNKNINILFPGHNKQYAPYTQELNNKLTEIEKLMQISEKPEQDTFFLKDIDFLEQTLELDFNKKLKLHVRYSAYSQNISVKVYGDFNSDFYQNLYRSLSLHYNNQVVNGFISFTSDNIYFTFIMNKKDITANQAEIKLSDKRFVSIAFDNDGFYLKRHFRLSVSQTRQLYLSPIKECSSWSILSDKKLLTDLHTHFDATLPADALVRLAQFAKFPIHFAHESLIKLNIISAEPPHKSIESYQELVNRGSSEKFISFLSLPYDRPVLFGNLEDCYILRDFITGQELMFEEILYEIAYFYKSQGITYAELSLNNILKPSWLKIAQQATDKIYEKTNVQLKFLVAVYNYSSDQEKRTDIQKIKIAAQCPCIVGVDFAGYENTDIRPIAPYLHELAKWANVERPQFLIRVHAGETKLFQYNIEQVIEVSEQYPHIKVRIGHGIYDLTENLMRRVKALNQDGLRCIFELQLDSNIALGVISDFRYYPLKTLFKERIPFVIGSDGYGLYATTVENTVASVVDALGDELNPVQVFDFINQTERDYISSQTSQLASHFSAVDLEKIVGDLIKYKTENKTTDLKNYQSNYIARHEQIKKSYSIIATKVPITIIASKDSKEKMNDLLIQIDLYFQSSPDINDNLCILLLIPDQFPSSKIFKMEKSHILVKKVSSQEVLGNIIFNEDEDQYVGVGDTIEFFSKDISKYVEQKNGVFIMLGDDEWIKSLKIELRKYPHVPILLSFPLDEFNQFINKTKVLLRKTPLFNADLYYNQDVHLVDLNAAIKDGLSSNIVAPNATDVPAAFPECSQLCI